MIKGQLSLSTSAIASVFITLLLLGLTLGNQTLTLEFIKQETLNIQTNRVVNSVVSMESVPKGFMEIDMDGYGIKYDEGNISMNYSGFNYSREIEESLIQSDITGPEDYEKIEGKLCIRKKPDEIIVDPGSC
jgi:hypothetical protein